MSVPEILKIGSKIERQSLNRIETQIQPPMYSSQDHISFQFDSKGILDKHTTLILPVVADDANQHLPVNTGIFSLIEEAKLSCQGITIATTSNAGHLMAIRELTTSYEVRENKRKCEIGCNNSFQVSTNDLYNTNFNNGQFRLSGTYTPVEDLDIVNCEGIDAPYRITTDKASHHTSQ